MWEDKPCLNKPITKTENLEEESGRIKAKTT